METAKAHSLKPFQYLTYLFERLPNIDLENVDALDALLPWSNSLSEDIRLKSE
nr:transposase domain-containing protein [Marinisporobacter balticus]